MRIVARIQNNYVVGRIVVGDDYELQPGEVEDIEQGLYIGDWYEASEGIFYRPINAVPPDSPIQPE